MSNIVQDSKSATGATDPLMQPVGGIDSDLRGPAQFVGGENTGVGARAAVPFHENTHFRQFVKFCLVGASSTLVTFIVLNVCKYKLNLPLFTSLTAAFLVSCCNGFFWNRHWTFKAARGNSTHEQSIKFLAVNLVGYLLNTSIVVLIVAHYATHGGLFGKTSELQSVLYNMLAGEKKSYPSLLVNGAQAAAVCIVVWWNYFANRLWTFKH